jgi:hypothetical protein
MYAWCCSSGACCLTHTYGVQATTGALVRPHDGPALELLKDVRFVEGAQGRVVEFEFGDNPFFGNKVRGS